jgi:hypothetical protein
MRLLSRPAGKMTISRLAGALKEFNSRQEKKTKTGLPFVQSSQSRTPLWHDQCSDNQGPAELQ